MTHNIQDLNERTHNSVAYKDPNLVIGYSCGEDIETGLVVKHDPARKGVVMIAGAGEGFAIAHQGSKEGCVLEVAICCGGACAKLGGTVAVGDSLVADANGKLIKGASGEFSIAVAETDGVLDDVIEVLMIGRPIA